MSTILRGALVALALSLASSAYAAEISIINKKLNVVMVKGEIESGDDERFDQLTKRLPPGSLIAFNSDGGQLDAGIKIGIIIHNKRFTTWAGGTCASVCALAWLAGTSRAVLTTSQVGFHSAYNGEGNVTSGGNAMVGAYLSRLGFGYETIRALTSAAPNEMNWLDDEKAKKYGIKITVMEPK